MAYSDNTWVKVADGREYNYITQQYRGSVTPGYASPSNPTVSKNGTFTNTNPTGTGTAAPQPGPGPQTQQNTVPDTSAQDQYYAQLKVKEQGAVRDALKALFAQYGLSSLYSKIAEYAKLDYSADSILIMLRGTPEYKKRFPAMEALAQQGRGISEAEYVGYEKSAAGYEQQFGLPAGMIMKNVTTLLTNAVSVDELRDRAELAAAASITAPADFKAEMKDRFGIDQGGLTAYYLDPEQAMPLLQKQYGMAIIGTEARRQSISGISTEYLALLQNEGVGQDEAQQGFGTVAAQVGLTGGAGETVSTTDLAENVFGTSAASSQKVRRVAAGRVGRFQEGGGFTGDRTGAAGIGVSST